MRTENYLRQLFNTIARNHGFNPVLLLEVIVLNARGYNNVEIAEMLGISRNTVSSYMRKLREIESPSFLRLVLFAILIQGGLYFLPSEVKSESSELYAG